MVHNTDNLKKFVSNTNKQLGQLNKAIVNFKKAHEVMTKRSNTTNLEKVITSYDVTIATLKQCK